MMQLTIIGFGNQAKSWAQNLRDSGFPVRVALRPGSPSQALAKEEGFTIIETGSTEFYQSDVIALLTPDLSHYEFLLDHGKKLKKDTIVLYAHGFSVLKHELTKEFPELQHVLFAPKSIGSELRKQYLLEGKLGAVYSLEFFRGESATTEKWLKDLAVAMGINLGPYKTTFRHETDADLYSEQGLLCSIVPYTAAEMFRHLVESGTEPELAYFECWHELQLIVNAMVEVGPEAFFNLISPNALIGSEKGFQKLFTDEYKNNLKNLLFEIQNGTFNQELDRTEVETTRNIIHKRWSESPLMKTFHKIQQDMK